MSGIIIGLIGSCVVVCSKNYSQNYEIHNQNRYSNVDNQICTHDSGLDLIARSDVFLLSGFLTVVKKEAILRNKTEFHHDLAFSEVFAKATALLTPDARGGRFASKSWEMLHVPGTIPVGFVVVFGPLTVECLKPFER